MQTPQQHRRWIAHVDLDAFFASCEQRDNPAYRERPVVVGALPGHRGVVAAASYEARKFGIHSAMPISEAYRRCPEAVFLRPDISKYKAVSHRVFDILRTITPVVEAASIDEAYLDLSGLEKLFGPPQAIGCEIKRRVLQKTGLTVSVGIGPNRLIAKLGSEHHKPDGLTVVQPGQVLDFLGSMPVSNLRGLGAQTQKVFSRLGIRNVAQIRAIPLARLEQHLGSRAAENFHRQAFGIASDRIEPERNRKSISKETTFETDISDPRILNDALRRLSAEVARTARRENLSGSVITLKVRFEGFETYTRQIKLAAATNDERVIRQTAWRLFQTGNLPAKKIRLIGVGISNWAGDALQADLFDTASKQGSSHQILKTMDDVTEKFGAGIIQLGVSPKPANGD